MFSIVPHARMDVLSGFYAQGVKVEVVVQEDLQIKAAGDDVKGVCVLGFIFMHVLCIENLGCQW